MKLIFKKLIIVSIILLSGCAHEITINSDISNLSESKLKIDKAVGYHISESNRNKKVVTPGGGGDKITYAPYKDTESAIYAVLSNKFKDVYNLKSLDDKSFIQENEIKLIFLNEIVTNSSSDSVFTWPATKFTIDLTIKAIKANGESVWEKQVLSTGEATFEEMSDGKFALAARRATEKAFLMLSNELDQTTF